MAATLPPMSDLVTPERLVAVGKGLVVLVIGLVLARAAAAIAARLASTRYDAQRVMLARRGVWYPLLALTLASSLHQAGFDLSLLLGAAGVLTVAIGFAAQTSASNMISGVFLLAERPFAIGDVIQLGGTTGEVLSVDLLSVKLRTLDNLYVRVPNETMLKSEITTLSHFPIRRLDLEIGVSYEEDLGRVREVLARVADDNPLCLDEPAPLFIFLGFGESSLDLQFSVWAARERFLDLRNSIQVEIKKAFDEAGIEIPFPHRTVRADDGGAPLAVRLVDAG